VLEVPDCLVLPLSEVCLASLELPHCLETELFSLLEKDFLSSVLLAPPDLVWGGPETGLDVLGV